MPPPPQRWRWRLAPSFQTCREMFSVGLVLAKQGQARLQQRFEFTVGSGWNQCVRQGAIDGLVIGDFVGGVSTVKTPTVEMREAPKRRPRLLRQCRAGRVGFGSDVKCL